MIELDKTYDPKKGEQEIYKLWEGSGFFNPDNLEGEPYSIVLPPPNITGTLHIGHALELTIQDILIRYQRLRGRKTLWLPGTDHAAIATQAKVEAIIYKKEGKTRQDLGREEFLKRVSQFAQTNHDTIVHQIRRMGASVDWSREAFTLDKKRSLAVYTAFKKMYDDGLIYRGDRIVNWDPELQTTVSDDEIQWLEEKTPLYYLRYGPFTIATARPETKFGDKYVVMHPADERYAQYKDGQKIKLEWFSGPITATVIKDEAIDMGFGTGVMTITPWHDTADFEIAQRHQLDMEQIIDDRGLLLSIAGSFAGQHIKKARPLIVEALKQKGLLEKVDENYTHRIAVNSRGGGLIEPQIKKQWFVAVDKPFNTAQKKQTTLKEIMHEAVVSGRIKILPEYQAIIYFHWITNLRDWCISRQIWYGHRIPAWYHEPRCVPRAGHEDDVVKCKEIIISNAQPECDFCNATYVQDPDTLDTWFSSSLWTFSTLGWPEVTNDLQTFHPTSIIGPGCDILFFWVARMILMTGYLLNDIPFHTVFLHGLVRDAQRQKMSKSRGNIIDPLDMTEKYGTDALRLALVFANASGSDMALPEDRVRGMKHFANKLWNIARFVLANVDNNGLSELSEKQSLTDADKNIIEKLTATKKLAAEHIEHFRLHEAAQEIYQFIWHDFADIYIEESKKQLKDQATKNTTEAILGRTLYVTLLFLHPFMPFITETIYQKIPGHKGLLMVQQW